jgi:predicted dehydrogenase
MTERRVRVAFVGVAGYGASHLGHALAEGQRGSLEIAGVVDPYAEKSPHWAAVRALGVPVYADLDAFHRERQADLTVIATPIHLHCPHTCAALAHGSHVLCEKPAAATIQDARRMAAAERETGRRAAIGYQWSYSDAVQELKASLRAGEMGKPRRLRTLVSWPRTASYYARCDWAGARASASGAWVLDSPVNNATAHYLHNALYVLGAESDEAATPVSVQAELYRANAIGNYDTAALRVRTAEGAEILFYTSHAVPSVIGPQFVYECDEATVTFAAEAADGFTVRQRDGTTRSFGDPSRLAAPLVRLVADAVVRRGERPTCGVRAASAHTLCVNGAQDSMPQVVELLPKMIRKTGGGDPLTYAEGLQAALVNCYNLGILPSEHGGYPWAQPGTVIDLRGYGDFPGGASKSDR